MELNARDDELMEALKAVDQLRLVAAAAAPALELLQLTLETNGMRRQEIHRSLGVTLSVISWARRQRSILESGSHEQGLALLTAEA